MTQFFVLIPLHVISKAFDLVVEKENMETGGPLVVSIKREGNKVLYIVNGIEERVLRGSPSSATLDTGSPFLWHSHPVGFGARLSPIDVRSITTLWGLQAISLYGTPPLFMVFGLVKVNDDVVLYNAGRKIATRQAKECLEFRAYVAAPSAKSVEVTPAGKARISWETLEGDECILIQDAYGLKPVNPEFVLSIVKEHTARYPSSVVSLLSLVRGVCSRGSSPDHLDLMRVISLGNTLMRLGVAPRYFVILKENNRLYRVTFKDDVRPEVIEAEIQVVEGRP